MNSLQNSGLLEILNHQQTHDANPKRNQSDHINQLNEFIQRPTKQPCRIYPHNLQNQRPLFFTSPSLHSINHTEQQLGHIEQPKEKDTNSCQNSKLFKFTQAKLNKMVTMDLKYQKGGKF